MIGPRLAGRQVILPGVSGRIRRLYDFELEPEVRDWLDSLDDSESTHYKVPTSQATSLSERPLRFEFFMSEAHTLGCSEPLALK